MENSLPIRKQKPPAQGLAAARERLSEFSFRTRGRALERFRKETFDVLVVGGGITGAAVARDAISRGLSVALVERNDFASGTSSRSSKLIHGGLRYLQNLEFGLVFEALSERALLLRTVPHLVRPLPFYFPVFKGDANGRFVLGLGMWLYDLLSLFRSPGFHKSLSRRKLLEAIPFLKKEGLRGGFRYFDASMWDDVLAVETLRGASHWGAAVANYVEAVSPLWDGDRIHGFRVRDLIGSEGEIELKARTVVVCAGPWTDEVGARLTPEWRTLLSPSKGVHLIFDLKRIPVPGAMVMSQPEDGRIAFVIPRPDFGSGVVIVGTTDGPTPKQPEKAEVDAQDVTYLIGLLNKYFPDLNLKHSDILSAYVGVRPLMSAAQAGTEAQAGIALQKVSREHHIELGPGGAVIVAGGKYTTHRKMAEEIVEFTLARAWPSGVEKPRGLRDRPSTKLPINPMATRSAIAEAQAIAASTGLQIPTQLFERFGAEALEVWAMRSARASELTATEGFPALGAQLGFSIRNEMTLHLEDFYFRRVPLFAARADHGLPFAKELACVWREEMGLDETAEQAEIDRLRAEISRRDAWRAKLG